MLNVVKTLLTQSRVGDMLGRTPYLPQIYASHFWRRRLNFFFGVYGSFEEASAAAASFGSGKSTWDDDTLAALIVDDAPDPDRKAHRSFLPSYYPYFFWLAKILKPGATVVDLGGAGGIGFELFTRYARMPDRARWHIVDLPALTARGLRRHGSDHPVLSFGETLADAPDGDVLVSAGCIQYMQDPLREIAGLLDRPKAPTHILLNKIALTSGSSYWTLQNLGSVISPYRVFGRSELLGFFQERGYAVRDEWAAPEITIDIPFHSDRLVAHLSGLLFAREGADD